AVRVDDVGPAAEDVARQLQEVGGRVVAAEAEAEAALAARRAVAGARVAPADGQGGDQVAAEAWVPGLVHFLDRDGNLRDLAARLDDDGGGAVFLRQDKATWGNFEDVVRLGHDVREGGQVAHRVIGVPAGDDDLLHRLGADEFDVAGLDDEFGGLADDLRA